MSERNNRILYLDILRILATCTIVMIHVASQYWDVVDTRSFEWKVLNFYDSISRWASPVFIMISGSLFLRREIPIRKLYTKYIFRIATAFVFWSFSYSFVLNFWRKWDIKNFFISFLKGQTHLWFLFVIVGLYMIVPFLYHIARNRVLSKYFCIMGFIFSFILPQAVSLISILYPQYEDLANTLINKLRIHFVMGFTSYFILGYRISNTEITVKARKMIYLFGFVGFISTILCSQFISNYTNTPSTLFYNSMSVNVLLEAICVFTFFKHKYNYTVVNACTKRIIQSLSKYSFGEYFIHVGVIYLLDKVLKINALTFNPLFAVPINTFLVCSISFASSAIIHHIPVLKKYIV